MTAIALTARKTASKAWLVATGMVLGLFAHSLTAFVARVVEQVGAVCN